MSKNPLSIGIAVEPVMYDGAVVNLYRAILTHASGEVVDRSGLYNHRPDAEAAGAELMRLYEEKSETPEICIGFLTYEAMDGMVSGHWDSCTLSKQNTTRACVPVYIKHDTVFVTRCVKD